MNTLAIDIVGTTAAIFTTASFVPQVWLIYKTKNADSISLGMYSVFLLGTALWLTYGLLLSAWPVVVANSITFSLACAIVVMKLRYQKTPPSV